MITESQLQRVMPRLSSAKRQLYLPHLNQALQTFGVDTLLLGFGLPDDHVHSPNEKFDLDALHKGARTAAALYDKLARLKVSGAQV